jgi:orotate phosphoribosyltransferase
MKTIIIEDLISTGKSSLQVVDVVKAAGLDVIGMVSIFTYGFSVAEKACADAGVKSISLTNYPTLIELAIEKGSIDPADQKTLLNWSENPSEWGRSL